MSPIATSPSSERRGAKPFTHARVGETPRANLGCTEAADLIVASMEKAIAAKSVTYDFARLMDGATEVKCSAFAEAMVGKM